MKNIAIVCGGFSGERVISMQSAEVVKANLSPSLYQTYLVDIDRDAWKLKLPSGDIEIDKTDFSADLNGARLRFDGVFNVIHGTPGEDGKLQGYFDMLGIPYNNSGVLAASLSFNKVFTNMFLKSCGVRVAESVWIKQGASFNANEIVEKLGLPCFVKPTAAGSSLGITKVKSIEQFDEAVRHAQDQDCDALVEAFLDGTELSCGCIQIDGEPRPVAVTEIVPANEFFDFDAKYTNSATNEITPARIDKELYDLVMSTTKEIYQYLGFKGPARVDYIYCKDGLYMVEPNSNPGLSSASILPQQAEYAGYSLEQFFGLSIEEMFKTAE